MNMLWCTAYDVHARLQRTASSEPVLLGSAQLFAMVRNLAVLRSCDCATTAYDFLLNACHLMGAARPAGPSE
jgi:hypothetical protein